MTVSAVVEVDPHAVVIGHRPRQWVHLGPDPDALPVIYAKTRADEDVVDARAPTPDARADPTHRR